jgi:hypothetical protein
VRRLHTRGVEHRERVDGHLVERVGRGHLARGPTVAIVEPDHLEALRREALAPLPPEVRALAAEPADHQERGKFRIPDALEVELDVGVARDRHRRAQRAR